MGLRELREVAIIYPIERAQLICYVVTLDDRKDVYQ